MRYAGRRKPYTQIGIRRLRCPRCRKVAVHQWAVCANGNRQVPICLDCDIAINRMVLKFLRIPNWQGLIAEYVRRNKSHQREERRMSTKRKAARKGPIQFMVGVEKRPANKGATFTVRYRTRRWTSKREAIRALARALRTQPTGVYGEVIRVQKVDGKEQVVGRNGRVAEGVSTGYRQPATMKGRE